MDGHHGSAECHRCKMASTTLIGLEQFERELKKLTEKVRGQVLRAALIKSVQPTVREAAAKAPSGTGGLSKSMTAQQMKYARADEAIVRVGPGRPKGSHGILLEFGTIHMAKHPFLASAYAATYREVIDNMGNEVGSVLAATSFESVGEESTGHGTPVDKWSM